MPVVNRYFIARADMIGSDYNTHMKEGWHKQLAATLKDRGISQRRYSEMIGKSEGYIKTMLRQGSEPNLSTAIKMCQVLDLPLSFLIDQNDIALMPVKEPTGELKPVALTETSIPVIGYVAAGKWLEVDPLNQDHEPIDTINFLPDSSLPADRTFGLIVDGDSLNKIAPPGSTLICVYFEGMAHDVADETLVIVERRRDGGELVEVTAKRYRKREKHIELWPESNHPDWQKPIILNGHDDRIETRITGIVKRIVIKP